MVGYSSIYLSKFHPPPTLRPNKLTGAGIAQLMERLGYGLDDRGSILHKGTIFFLFATASKPALGTTQSSMGNGDPLPSLKQSGRETDHSPPSSAEVKNTWSYTSTPPYVFMSWYLVKHTDKFTFAYIIPGKLVSAKSSHYKKYPLPPVRATFRSISTSLV
jgi:hypothetical protein